MKNDSTQQEVLLMTDTAFAARPYSEKDMPENAKNVAGSEALKKACWNGLLKDILPEIFIFNDPGAKLYLWQVKEANHFFSLEMGERPTNIDKSQSIDPYYFMAVQEFN